MKQLLLLLCILMIAGGVMAQDGLTVTQTPEDGQLIMSSLDIVLGVLGGLAIGSLSVLGAGAYALSQIAKSPAIMYYIERAFDSQPQDIKAIIREVVNVANEATDEKPLQSK